METYRDYTMVVFRKFCSETPEAIFWFQLDIFLLHWPCKPSKISQRPKKANKGHTGHCKGRRWVKMKKNNDFFMFLGPFGVNKLAI